MKFVLIFGSGAVGKMTVGQELMKLTGLRLFHNHMTIEPVVATFGYYDGKVITELRETIFKAFAASGLPGMIFTYMWDFARRDDWDYIEHVKEIFAPYGTEFYYVELVAPLEVRLQRNATENRIRNKPSKANLEMSNRFLLEEKNYRLVSNEGEIPFDNYLRIENADMSPEDAAKLIRDTFGL